MISLAFFFFILQEVRLHFLKYLSLTDALPLEDVSVN